MENENWEGEDRRSNRGWHLKKEISLGHLLTTATIAITSDTMRLAGAGTTGNRSLAANGIARARKLSATEWIIDGTGLT